MNAGVFVPWKLVETLGPKELPAVLVVATLAEQSAAAATGWVSVSVRELAERTRLTEPQVRRALDLAVDVGALERRTRAGGGRGAGRRTYTYRTPGRRPAAA